MAEKGQGISAAGDEVKTTQPRFPRARRRPMKWCARWTAAVALQ